MPGINPFKPTSPVNPGMFVGRLKEVERLESHLLQTVSGNPVNFALTGERGIGKSSLLNYIKWVAEGQVAMPGNERTLRFLVVDADIDANTTQLSLVGSIQRGLNHGLRGSEPARAFLAKSFEFLQRLEVKGFKLGSAETPKGVEQAALDDFAYSLSDTAKRLCDPELGQSLLDANFDGILIMIDEVDNASRDLSIGSFFKLLTERLERRGCNRVMFGIAGLPRLQEVLTASHKSAPRVFEELILDRLHNEEAALVLDRCMERAIDDNSHDYHLEHAAKTLLVGLERVTGTAGLLADRLALRRLV